MGRSSTLGRRVCGATLLDGVARRRADLHRPATARVDAALGVASVAAARAVSVALHGPARARQRGCSGDGRGFSPFAAFRLHSIFSSAENFRRVLRRMSRTAFSAESFWGMGPTSSRSLEPSLRSSLDLVQTQLTASTWLSRMRMSIRYHCEF